MGLRSAFAPAITILLLAASTAHATEDFDTLKEKGELNGKPEVAYAHYFATFTSMEPTVFCHVGSLPCGNATEPGATPEQQAEVQLMIKMMGEQVFFSDMVLQSADVTGDKATLHYTARGNDGNPVIGTVKMEKRTYRHWRLVEQEWRPKSL